MTQKKILVVEDERDLNDAYRMILQSQNYDVATAFNGQEALEYIEANGDPAIILLDLRMPAMNGIEFLEAYEAPKHPNTAIILFSNYEAQKEVDEAFELGAERYVLKALISPKELIRTVEGVLAENS